MSREEVGKPAERGTAPHPEESRKTQPKLSTVKSFSQLYNEIVNPGRERHQREHRRDISRMLAKSVVSPPARPSLRKSYIKSKSEGKLKKQPASMYRRSKSNHYLVKEGAWLKTNTSAMYEQGQKQLAARLQFYPKLRLHEELHQAVLGIDHSRHLHLQAGECFLDFESFWEILLALGFASSYHQRIARRLWEALGGEEYGGMMLENLRILLHAFDSINPPPISSAETDDYHLSSDMKLTITAKLQKLLTTDFACFRQNQRNHISARKTQPKQSPPKQPILFHEAAFVSKLIREQQAHRKHQLSKIIELKKNVAGTRKKPNDKENHSNNGLASRPKCHQPVTIPTSPKKSPKLNAYRYPPTYLFSLHEPSSADGTLYQPRAISIRSSNTKRVPLLSVDVNLGEGQKYKLIVYEGESAKIVAMTLAAKHNLSDEMRTRFETTLQSHIAGLLTRIDELPEEASELE